MVTEPRVELVAYEVSRLPADHLDAYSFMLRVQRRSVNPDGIRQLLSPAAPQESCRADARCSPASCRVRWLGCVRRRRGYPCRRWTPWPGLNQCRPRRADIGRRGAVRRPQRHPRSACAARQGSCYVPSIRAAPGAAHTTSVARSRRYWPRRASSLPGCTRTGWDTRTVRRRSVARHRGREFSSGYPSSLHCQNHWRTNALLVGRFALLIGRCSGAAPPGAQVDNLGQRAVAVGLGLGRQRGEVRETLMLQRVIDVLVQLGSTPCCAGSPRRSRGGRRHSAAPARKLADKARPYHGRLARCRWCGVTVVRVASSPVGSRRSVGCCWGAERPR